MRALAEDGPCWQNSMTTLRTCGMNALRPLAGAERSWALQSADAMRDGEGGMECLRMKMLTPLEIRGARLHCNHTARDSPTISVNLYLLVVLVMARATRSSATQLHNEKDKLPDPPSARTKSSTKKRKRTSIADNNDHPPQKQLRSDTTIKEENQPDIDDDNPTTSKVHNLPLAADVPIDPSDAQQILDIVAL